MASAEAIAASGYDSAVERDYWPRPMSTMSTLTSRVSEPRFDADADALAGADLLELVGQVRKPVNRLAVGLDDHVADRTGARN